MYKIFVFLITIISFALVFIIMIQNPKGGGLSSSFGEGGGSQMFGVQSTNKFLYRTTWGLVISMVVLILISNFAISIEDNQSIVEKNTMETQQEQPVEEMEEVPLKDINSSEIDTNR